MGEEPERIAMLATLQRACDDLMKNGRENTSGNDYAKEIIKSSVERIKMLVDYLVHCDSAGWV